MDLARRYKLLGLKIHEFGLNDTSTSQCCQKKRRLPCRPIMLPKAQHVPRMQPHLSYKNHLCQSIHPFLLLYILPQPQVLEIVVIHWGPGNTSPPTTNPYCQPLLFSFLVLSFLLFPRIPHIPPCPLIALRCFNTASLASKNLSTQFCIHGSSFLSKPLDEMLPVIHFFQHKSVSSCTATSKMSR